MKEGFIIIDELVVPSTFDSITLVESMIDRICEKMGVIDNYGNVLIAVTEAYNNAVIHGNKNIHNATVCIQSFSNDTFFTFSIEDEGSGFDFNQLPDPTSPENIEKENGRGIFLMKNLSEEVAFENNGKRVVIYFSK